MSFSFRSTSSARDFAIMECEVRNRTIFKGPRIRRKEGHNAISVIVLFYCCIDTFHSNVSNNG